jgi:Dolichyl-phosphate-mannose-protein mannosyltransferase
VKTRHGSVLLALYCTALLATLVPRAHAKPFWHDEVYTILETQLPSVTTLWTAQRDGLDLSPPLNTIAVRLIGHIVGVGRVATRSVSLLAFMGACVVAFVIVRQRSSTVWGLVAVLLLSYTAAYRYAYEARGYELALFLCVVALYAWAEAASGRNRSRNLAILGVAIAGALWTHYYTVLILVPIGLGETVRLARSRGVDRGLCIAVASGCLAAAPLVLLASAGASQVGTFWTRGADRGVGATYAFVWNDLIQWWLPALGITALLVAARAWRRPKPPPIPFLPWHEIVAGVTLLLIPVIAVWVGASLAHGVFVPRYAIFAAVGPVVVAPVVLHLLGPLSRFVALAVLLTLTWLLAQTLWQTFVPAPPRARDPFDGRTILSNALHGSDPVAITGGSLYLELWYAAPRYERERMAYLGDPVGELQQTGADSIDIGYLTLQRWARVGVQDATTFLRDHREFLLYDCGANWIGLRLIKEGAVLDELGRDIGGTLYRVRLQ